VKLRIHRNSLRLRLSRSDVEQFLNTGICAGELRFGPDSQLTYTLETSSRLTLIEAQYRQDCIRVLLPLHVGPTMGGVRSSLRFPLTAPMIEVPLTRGNRRRALTPSQARSQGWLRPSRPWTNRRVLLTVYKSRLTNWRNTVVKQYTRAWKDLILHLALLGLIIAFLTVVAAALRRVTTRYVHDANRRRRILVVQRILVWLPIVLAIAFAFASDLSSLATYLGLLTAGIAVALGCTPERHSCGHWLFLASWKAGTQSWRPSANFWRDRRHIQHWPATVPTERD
jgi:hypothetical protein